MRKVFLLIIAMCLICSVASAAKEATKMSRDDTATPVYLYDDVNAGDTFVVSAPFVDLADDASQTIVLTVSSTNATFIEPSVEDAGDGIAYLYESSASPAPNLTISTVGTNADPVQTNRPLAATNTTTTTASYGATLDAYGTVIDQFGVANGGKGQRVKAIAGRKYLLRYENESGGTTSGVAKIKIDEY
ncbi:hypothetical protein ACFL3D_01830 [Candidatus Omnitrophota bacterium]